MDALFALFSAMLSVQPIWLNPVADLRPLYPEAPSPAPNSGIRFVDEATRVDGQYHKK